MNPKTRVARKGEGHSPKPRFNKKEIPLPARSVGIELPSSQYHVDTLVDFICEQRPILEEQREYIYEVLDSIDACLILGPVSSGSRSTIAEYIVDIAMLHSNQIGTLERFLSTYDLLWELQKEQDNGKEVEFPENAKLFVCEGGLRKIYEEAVAGYDGRETSFEMPFPSKKDVAGMQDGLPEGKSIKKLVEFVCWKRWLFADKATLTPHFRRIDRLLMHQSLGRDRKGLSERREMLGYIAGIAVLEEPLDVVESFEATYSLIVGLYKRMRRGERFKVEAREAGRLEQFLKKAEMFFTVEGLRGIYEEARERGEGTMDFLTVHDLPYKAKE